MGEHSRHADPGGRLWDYSRGREKQTCQSKMNRKQVITLIIAVAVIGGAGLLVYKKRNQSWEASSAQLGGKVVKDFPLNDIEQFRIKQHTGEDNLVRKNDVRVVQERNGYLANFETISDFM